VNAISSPLSLPSPSQQRRRNGGGATVSRFAGTMMGRAPIQPKSIVTPTMPTQTQANAARTPASPGAATLQVRLFAGLREAAGWGERTLTWQQAGIAPPGHPADGSPVTPRSLWRQLQLGSDALPADLRVAVNQAFASPDQALQPGDEVAFLPPISGG